MEIYLLKPQKAMHLLSLSLALLLCRMAHAEAQPCASLPHPDHPSARITNGRISAVVFLPDANNGYYRGPRFDWSGVVACASLDGHEFFGEWFNRYDPAGNDSITGPAEEFRRPSSELGYDEAKQGGNFIKIGVGALRRSTEKPYRFSDDYAIVDHGTWSTKTRSNSITFKQVLRSDTGYRYVYEKTVALDRGKDVLRVSHTLRNTGQKTLDTAVYSHGFFLIDRRPIASGTEVRLRFAPQMDHPIPSSVILADKTIRVTGTIEPGHGIGTYVTGFSSSPSDFDFTFEDTARGIGIQETADSPLVKMYLWGTPRTLCPEGYIDIHVAPGQSQSWTVRYRLFAKQDER